jgi:hypothetical protein
MIWSMLLHTPSFCSLYCMFVIRGIVQCRMKCRRTFSQDKDTIFSVPNWATDLNLPSSLGPYKVFVSSRSGSVNTLRYHCNGLCVFY